jgi:hypothetical protein
MVVLWQAPPDSAEEANRQAAIPEEKSAAVQERPAPPQAASAVQNQVLTPPASPEDDAPSEVPASGGKRFVKAVGRFLHIGGKKETPEQSAR